MAAYEDFEGHLQKKLRKQLTAGTVSWILLFVLLLNALLVSLIVKYPSRLLLLSLVLVFISISETVALILAKKYRVFEWVSFNRPEEERKKADDLQHYFDEYSEWTYTTNNKDQICFKGTNGDDSLFVCNHFIQELRQNQYSFLNMEFKGFHRVFWPELKMIEKDCNNG